MLAVSFGSVDQRVRVRAAAGLHGGDLLRLAEVADVEDADAAEALRRSTVSGHALRAAVDAAARLLDRHEQQVAVDRHVALAAGAHDRREQPRLLRRLDVVGVEAVEVAEEQVGAAEREVGVREVRAAAWRRRRRRAGGAPASAAASRARSREASPAAGAPASGAAAAVPARRRDAPGRRLRIEEPLRLRQGRDQLHVARGLAGVAEARLQPDARIVRDGGGAACPARSPRSRWTPRTRRRHSSLVTTGLISGAP